MPDQGTFAEYICVPVADVYDKPPHLSFEEAAAVPLGGLTAWRAVITQANVRKGDKALVTGAGSGVSTFAIQWAVQHGAEVWVSSGSPEKIDKAKTWAQRWRYLREPGADNTLAGGGRFRFSASTAQAATP